MAADLVFSEAEIAEFIEVGYLVLREAFARDVAAAGQAFVRDRIASAHPVPPRRIVHLRECFSGSPFDRAVTPRLRAGLEQLMGTGRALIHGNLGWWPVLFPGFAGPGGWHVDGADFRHRLTSPEQALVPIFLFSDVGSGDGGTAMVRGSHRDVARLLARAEPSGLSAAELQSRLPSVRRMPIVELTGRAGDVALLHPFLIHGSSANRGRHVRFACNPRYSFAAPMELDRADGDHSAVENAIRRALVSG